MSGENSAGANRKAFSAKESLQILYRTAQETAAGKDNVGEVEALSSFLRILRYFHTPGNGLRKVENQESGENLLQNQHRDFRVEVDQAHRVFQAAEGGFNTPAPSIFQEGTPPNPDL